MTRAKSVVQFVKFNRANPDIFHLAVRFTREAQARWGDEIGIRLVLERVRWEVPIETARDDEYKLNNNFAPFYSRIIMRTNPDLRGVFSTRLSVADLDGRPANPDQVTLWEEAHADDSWLEEAVRDLEDTT